MNVAFVLLTYAHNAPAGIERSIGALAQGLRDLGHAAVVIAASSDCQSPPSGGVVALESVRLPHAAVEEDLLRAVADPGSVVAEVHEALAAHDIDVVCWCDAAWGLGFLAPHPRGVRTALMVRVLRTDALLGQALDRRPDAVLTNSPFLKQQALEAGLDAADWIAVPNAVMMPIRPPAWPDRENGSRSCQQRRVAIRHIGCSRPSS